MGRHLRLLLTAVTLLFLALSASCMRLDEPAEEGTVVTTTSTVATTTTPPPPEQPPEPDDGFDDEGFANEPSDDETKRY